MTFLITKRHRIGVTTGFCYLQTASGGLSPDRTAGLPGVPLNSGENGGHNENAEHQQDSCNAGFAERFGSSRLCGASSCCSQANSPYCGDYHSTPLSCMQPLLQRAYSKTQAKDLALSTGAPSRAPSGKSGRKRPARPDLIQTQAEQLTPIQDRQLQYVPVLACSVALLRPRETYRGTRNGCYHQQTPSKIGRKSRNPFFAADIPVKHNRVKS